MTPPPPPPSFRISRRGDGPRFDPALDDDALRAARDSLAQGRWTDARSLLIDTGEEWDRRGHRITVLAQAPGSEAWAREWQLAEPDSPDAAVLTACAAVLATAGGGGRPHAAQEAVEAAALMAPADPTPWLAALLLARHTGGLRECRSAFEELRARHPGHHHAHHLMAAALAETPDGPQDARGSAVYEFALHAAGQAPGDSPLALLPVVAHAELFRARAARKDGAAEEREHWSGRHAQHLVRSAFDWWLEWGCSGGHPRRVIDLNFLAYAKFHEGRLAEAAALFQRVGKHATPEPWAYAGRDPGKAFCTARGAALGPA